jgi:hypothetical protein
VLQNGVAIAISIMIEGIQKHDPIIVARSADSTIVTAATVDIELSNRISSVHNPLSTARNENDDDNNDDDDNEDGVEEPDPEKGTVVVINSDTAQNEEEEDGEEGDFEIDERGLKFSSSIKFADKTSEIRSAQLKQHGLVPLEYIPLSDIKAELAVLEALAYTGQLYDEARLEHLYACREINREYQAEQEEEMGAAWGD